MFSKKIQVKQRDFTDCGAACLVSIAAYYNITATVSEVRGFAGTDRLGTNIKGLLAAATSIGFQAKGAKGSLAQLSLIPLPAIAHVILENGFHHYVVIYKISKKNVEYMDPQDGLLHKAKLSDFEKTWSGVLVLLIPDSNISFKTNKQSKLGRFIRLTRPYKSRIAITFIGSLIYTMLGFSSAIYMQKLVDQIIVTGNNKLLNLASIAMIIILFAQTFFGFYKSILGTQTAQLIDSSLIGTYYKHLVFMPQRFFSSMRTGELISRINDAFKIRAFINDITVSMIVNVSIIILSIVMMFFYSWKLIVVVAFIFPTFISIYIITNRLNKKYQRLLMELSAALEADLVESIEASITIKQFSLETKFVNKINIRLFKLMRTIYINSKSGLGLSFVADFFSKLFNILLLWVGAYLVMQRELTIGELLSFYAVLGYLTPPMLAIISSNRGIQEALIAADRLFEILDMDNELVANKPLAIKQEKLCSIAFKNIYFQYGMRATVLDDLSFNIIAGTTTAIIGKSGSGKTTIISLLHKLYPTERGMITINDIDINHWDTHYLRRKIAIVPQKVDLFADTVISNIAIGDEQPDFEKIIFLSKLTGVVSFIEELPENYHTILSEQGSNLSGGQRQRLAIVRALYREPDVLVLDEATSNLDVLSESEIQKALTWFIEKGKTVIIIAHRLSTIKTADNIIVLDKGTVKVQGKHIDLLDTSEYYRNLWNQSSVL
ncbi:MAG: peptidase domain-containing ABC transporter [Sediminibacterium sp.]|nr:peptidase domain-containing ABC transporter [Sediminibacterium sp.]MBX9779649.1 peptidase domain-containing ABC transporter [Chitinophagaceae bacterium]